jgi:hypothetical protein
MYYLTLMMKTEINKSESAKFFFCSPENFIKFHDFPQHSFQNKNLQNKGMEFSTQVFSLCCPTCSGTALTIAPS